MRETKDQAAKRLWPDITYDCALPQPWVDAARDVDGFDVRPHFVWGYPPGSVFGRPLPLSDEGKAYLRRMGSAA